MSIRTVVILRRISQVVFFAIFFWLILKTNFEVDLSPDSAGQITLPYPVSIALQLDPLVALVNLLANATLYAGLAWALVVLIPTIFMGRFFCGWVCPLGSLNHWVSEIRSERRSRRGKNKIESNRYRPYQKIKYYVLFFVLGAALTGSLLAGLLDPLPLLARSLGTVVLPTIHTAALGTVDWVKSWGFPPFGDAAQFVYDLIAPILLNFRQMHFHAIFSIGIVFLLVIVLNRWFTRFWCRGICPLGALLGLFSRFSIFGLEKNKTACDNCNVCLLHCQGADNPDVGKPWRQAECVLCLNCQNSCPHGALKFKFFPKRESEEDNPGPIDKIDVSKRKTTAAVVGGLAAVPLLRSTDIFEANFNPNLIRPPGAVQESDFLSRCIRCGQCMRVCPNNALHPTLWEAGVEGLWTPYMIPRVGYCEPTCTLCGEVCPTGAIVHLTHDQKVGTKEQPPVQMGTAFVDRGSCLPWAMATPCIVCEEWCPTTPKAIYLEETTVTGRNGNEIAVKRPVVDPNECTGCGACEFACPIVGKAAIRVTAAGESRDPEHQFMLDKHRRRKRPSTT